MRKGSRLLTVLAIASVGVLAQASAALAADCPGADTKAGEQGASEIEASVLCLVNDLRRNAGLAAVAPNAKLRQAASRHSGDMVSEGFFSHTSPGGDTFIDRITDSGYMRGARSWLVGENLVWGSGDLGTPASMVDAWMESPPHRANLLRSRFREIGISAFGGTPYGADDSDGVTVTSEYGYRDVGKKKLKKSKKSRKARARARARAQAERS